MELTHIFHERVCQRVPAEHERAAVDRDKRESFAATPLGDRVVLVACAGEHIVMVLFQPTLAEALSALGRRVNEMTEEGYEVKLGPEVEQALNSSYDLRRR